MTSASPVPYAISSDCMNCGVCEFMCPQSAITPAPRHFVIEAERCDGCARCVPFCLVRAIIPRDALADRQRQTASARLKRVLKSA